MSILEADAKISFSEELINELAQKQLITVKDIQTVECELTEAGEIELALIMERAALFAADYTEDEEFEAEPDAEALEQLFIEILENKVNVLLYFYPHRANLKEFVRFNMEDRDASKLLN